MNCSPWVDYVEEHKGESAVGVVMFVNCLLTILANIILFIVIFSNKESREQVWFAWTRNGDMLFVIFFEIFFKTSFLQLEMQHVHGLDRVQRRLVRVGPPHLHPTRPQ